MKSFSVKPAAISSVIIRLVVSVSAAVFWRFHPGSFKHVRFVIAMASVVRIPIVSAIRWSIYIFWVIVISVWKW